MLYLDYGVFEIYYHRTLRLPNCVIERFNGLPDQPINRKDFSSKFQPDLHVAPEDQMTHAEYEDSLMYGFSYGHHAPASFHKSSHTDYLNTFLFTNNSVQDMTMNSGIWALLEEWTARIIRHFQTVIVLTGSIKGEDRQFRASRVHVPRAMYKSIVILQADRVYECSYLISNEPHVGETELEPYLISRATLMKTLRTENDFDLAPIFDLIGILEPIPKILLDPVRGIQGFNLVISKSIRAKVRQSTTYYQILSASSLEELDRVIRENKITADMQKYCDLSRQRLML